MESVVRTDGRGRACPACEGTGVLSSHSDHFGDVAISACSCTSGIDLQRGLLVFQMLTMGAVLLFALVMALHLP